MLQAVHAVVLLLLLLQQPDHSAADGAGAGEVRRGLAGLHSCACAGGGLLEAALRAVGALAQHSRWQHGSR
jgi:hypothetical protein